MSNEHANTAPGQNKSFEIFVNGTPETVTDHRISYGQVVRLAFPQGPFDVLYSVSYANIHGKDGTLALGQETEVKEGMSFNVIKTNRS